MILGATLVLAMATGGAFSAEAAPETLRYVVSMAGASLGSLRSITSTIPEGGFERRQASDLHIARGGPQIVVTEHSLSLENSSGELLGFEIVRTGLGPSDWTDSVERVDGAWRRIRNRGTSPAIDTLRAGELLGPVGLDRLLTATLDSVRFVELDPVDLLPRIVKARYLRTDTLGSEDARIACRLFALVDSASGEQVHQWRDRTGTLWREEDVRLGWVLEREALARPPNEGLLDALDWAQLAVTGEIPSSPPCEILMLPLDQADRVDRASLLTEGPGQSVTPGPSEGSWRIRIAPPAPDRTTEADRTGWSKETTLAAALRPGLMVDADAPDIRQFAEETTRRASSPTEEALLLERAVHRAIRTVDLGTAFATASQTLRDQRGDCTEHAVLLAACCRARGIPSRLVAGLVPLGGKMVFHLWTEVYLDGWVGLDATLGRGHAPICGLALLRWEQPEDGMADFNQVIAGLVGRFRFEIVPGQ